MVRNISSLTATDFIRKRKEFPMTKCQFIISSHRRNDRVSNTQLRRHFSFEARSLLAFDAERAKWGFLTILICFLVHLLKHHRTPWNYRKRILRILYTLRTASDHFEILIFQHSHISQPGN